MKRIRYALATIALAAALSGLLPLGAGLASVASTASSHHASASFGVGHSTKAVATVRQPPCPWAGGDC